MCLQCFFLGSTGQLPTPKQQPHCHNNKCGNSNEPKTKLNTRRAVHGIIKAMNYLVPIAFTAILGCLCAALYSMLKDGRNGKLKTNNMARALAFRVGISCLLFACILIAWKLGYLHPTGIPIGY